MTVENVKVIVTAILQNIMGKKAQKIIDTIDEKQDGILVYLSHGATLGDAIEVQRLIKQAGLQIPEQLGNAVIYVTSK